MGFQDLFHPPRRGAFHLSLTVLVRYRSRRVFSLGGWSPRLPTAYHVGGRTQAIAGSARAFAYGALTRSGRPFQGRSASARVSHSPAGRAARPATPATPAAQRRPPWHAAGLGCPRFVRHYCGDALSSSGYVRCFSWPGAPPRPMRSGAGGAHLARRVPPFGRPRLPARQRLPEAFRGLATPFVGTTRPGIHPMRVCAFLCSAGHATDVPSRLTRWRSAPLAPSAQQVVAMLDRIRSSFACQRAGGKFPSCPVPTHQKTVCAGWPLVKGLRRPFFRASRPPLTSPCSPPLWYPPGIVADDRARPSGGTTCAPATSSMAS
jgi:hypothetical protein